MATSEGKISLNTLRAIPRYKRVLELREAGVTVAEIARMLGVGEKMVYLMLSKAHKLRAKGML